MFRLSKALWCGKFGFFFSLMPTIISASANYGGVEHCQIFFSITNQNFRLNQVWWCGKF